jgi:hypothetical protein
VEIEGVEPSAEIRARLKGQTVLLAFSRGKDSIAAWLALRAADVNVIPYYLYGVPDLEFVDESLRYFADFFGWTCPYSSTPILQLPHVSLYRHLQEKVFQPPERFRAIEAAAVKDMPYDQVNNFVREFYDLPEDAWVCDGVRAADSPNRRVGIKSHGAININSRQIKVVWDWKIAEIRKWLDASGVQLPPDYEMFGRSLDGLDYRFLVPLKQHFPRDYARLIKWYPLAELELRRRELWTDQPEQRVNKFTVGRTP